MDLMDRSEEELKKLAKEYKIDLRTLKGKGKADLVTAIAEADVEMRIKAEANVKAKLVKEAEEKLRAAGFPPDKKRVKPSPETVAIYGGTDPLTGEKKEPSKKYYYVWTNLEDAGQTQKANLGGKFVVKLYDGKIHCLPEFAVRRWEQTSVYPEYNNRKNPVTGLEESVLARFRPRWMFKKLEEAPANAQFGVVINRELEKKHNLMPVPA